MARRQGTCLGVGAVWRARDLKGEMDRGEGEETGEREGKEMESTRRKWWRMAEREKWGEG